MGQYYKVVNLDKKQYLHPHNLGDGLKLMEFGSSGGGTMMALAILLSDGNGQGGGDLDSEQALVGSWAGDRIVVVGDYAGNDEKYGIVGTKENEDSDPNSLYDIAENEFENISFRILDALTDNEYEREHFAEKTIRYGEGSFGMGREMPEKLRNKIMKGFKVVQDPKNERSFTVERIKKLN